MKNKKSFLNLFLALTFMSATWLSFQNCADKFQPTENSEGDGGTVVFKMQELEQKIEDMLSSDSCQSDNECKYMALGEKACGGPKSYIYFSSRMDGSELPTLVAEYNEAEKKWNSENSVVSDCMYVMPPEALMCVDNKCVPR